MKIVKKIFTGLLTIILIDLIVLLVLNMSLKDFIVKEILINSISTNNELLNVDSSNIENPIIANNEVIKEVLQDEQIQEDLGDFLDDFIKNLSDDDIESLSTEEMQEEIITYVKEHKDELSEKTGVEITDEMIDKSNEMLEDVDTEKALKQEINNYKKNLTKEEKFAIKVFDFVNSVKLRMILIISIILDIILIAIIQRSTYKWIKNLSYSMTIAGLSIIVLAMSLRYVISTMTMVVINIKSITTLGIILLAFGIIIQIVYRLMIKYYIKENEYEVS